MDGEMVRESLVSIVIPVYNAERSLDKCLGSILLQDYKNLEIVLIDDGSQDTSSVICEKYRELYPEKITYVRQKNGGPSVARNRGIKLSKGEYIAFVDSDDTIAPNMISTMAQKAEETDVEMVICAYWKISNEGKTEHKYTLEEGIYTGKDQKKILYSLLSERPGDVPPYSWVRLTRKSFFDKTELRFSERLYRSEDYHFWVRVHSVIEKVYLLSQTPLYDYYENNASITHKHINGYWEDVQFIYRDLKKGLEGNTVISEQLDVMFVKRSLIALNNAAYCQKGKEACREMIQVVKNEKLNQVIKELKVSKIDYYAKYRSLMVRGLKGVIVIKYMMKWLKGRFARFRGKSS